MGRRIALLVALLVLYGFGYSIDIDCSNACQTPLARLQFNGSSDDQGYYAKQCTNKFQVQSIFSCMRVYCNHLEVDAGLVELQANCIKYGSIELLPWSVIDNITYDEAETWPHIKIDDLNDFFVHNSPVYVERSLFMLSLRSSTAWNRSEITRMNYGYAMLGFFVVVFAISISAKIIDHLVHAQLSTARDGLDRASSFWRLGRLSVMRYITTPALFTQHVAQPMGWCTVPQRIQSLTIVAFILVNIILCCISYDLFEGNLNWPTVSAQFWRYFSDRTGVISLANMPLMFAFGMRNNVLFWLTGWSFPTFNMFHRWVARVATVEAILHSFGYTIECFLDGGKDAYLAQWTQQYWQLGVVATVSMSLLCGLSILPLRQYYYEFFLAVHIFLAIAFIIGMWFHVVIFGSQYTSFIWPCIAVWAFDRILRISRIVKLNAVPLSGTAKYCSNANLIRINVPVRSNLPPQPGTYYYIYGIGTLKFWESHPFTLSTWRSNSESSTQHVLTFLIRPYDSYTARLRDSLMQNRTSRRSTNTYTSECQIRLAIEGPYGNAHDLTRYDCILFIVGGTGITVALSHIQALHEAMTKGDIPVRRVHLIWVVRDESLYHDVYQHELSTWLESSPLTRKAYVQVDIHVTRGKGPDVPHDHLLKQMSTVEQTREEAASPETPLLAEVTRNEESYGITGEEDKYARSSTSSACVSISYYRPSIHEAVSNTAEKWCTADNRLAVVCCGPAAMADDTRAAVVSAYARGYEGISLHPETFTW